MEKESPETIVDKTSEPPDDLRAETGAKAFLLQDAALAADPEPLHRYVDVRR